MKIILEFAFLTAELDNTELEFSKNKIIVPLLNKTKLLINGKEMQIVGDIICTFEKTDEKRNDGTPIFRFKNITDKKNTIEVE